MTAKKPDERIDPIMDSDSMRERSEKSERPEKIDPFDYTFSQLIGRQIGSLLTGDITMPSAYMNLRSMLKNENPSAETKMLINAKMKQLRMAAEAIANEVQAILVQQ
jgi:hypothetical protein